MNINQKFIQEAKDLESRWAKNKLLDGIDKYSRGQTAVLLECQRLTNETYYFSLMKGDKVIAQIPTKCTNDSQIKEIDDFLRSHGILGESIKVALTGFVPNEKPR